VDTAKKNVVIALSTTAPFSEDPLLAVYEGLRYNAVEGEERKQSGVGLALLLSRGMRGWMQACKQLLPVVPRKVTEPPTQAEPLPRDVRTDVIVLLTGMLLQRSRRVS
jgi:hypothetical protein